MTLKLMGVLCAYFVFIVLTGGKQMLKMKRLVGDECLNTDLQIQHN